MTASYWPIFNDNPSPYNDYEIIIFREVTKRIKKVKELD